MGYYNDHNGDYGNSVFNLNADSLYWCRWRDSFIAGDAILPASGASHPYPWLYPASLKHQPDSAVLALYAMADYFTVHRADACWGVYWPAALWDVVALWDTNHNRDGYSGNLIYQSATTLE